MKNEELNLQRQADQDEQEMEEYRRTRAIEDIEISAKSGGELEPEQIQLLAQDMGMTIPQFNAYYASYQASKEASDYEMGLKLAKLEKDVATVDWETEKIDKGAYSYTYVYDPTDREGTYKEIGKAPRWKYTGGGDNGNESDIKGAEGDFLQVIGEDGFASPEDYLKIKRNWIAGGGTAFAFDDEFEDRRNPRNNNYDISAVEEVEERDYAEELKQSEARETIEGEEEDAREKEELKKERVEWETKAKENPKDYKVVNNNDGTIKIISTKGRNKVVFED